MGINNSRMGILSDSQAAIKALSTNLISSELAKEFLGNLNALTKHNPVVIGWVPGHKGVPGNEAADKFAREGSITPLQGPEPAVGISSSLLKGAVNRWMYRRHCDYWYQIEGLKNSKSTLRKPSSELQCRLTKLNRREARIAKGLITEHCGLRKQLRTMGIFEGDPSCRLCGGDEETAAHIIYSCEALAARRFNLFGDSTIPEEGAWYSHRMRSKGGVKKNPQSS